MSLITRLYNVKHDIHFHQLQSEFSSLTVDPYVKNGFRRKHIVRYVKHKKEFVHVPNKPLFQSKQYNPTHGDIQRIYPEFTPTNQCVLPDLLNLFADVAQVPNGSTILIQAQRITCSPYDPGFPSVEDWHQDNVTKVGVICVDRQNIEGGINQFRPTKHHPEDVCSIMLKPGYMVVFDDDQVQHRVTPITSQDKRGNGYRDVVLLSYPDYLETPMKT